MSKTMKLGDTVRGEYHGVEVEGVIVSFDHGGRIYVRPSSPVTVYGVERDTVQFTKSDLTVVKAGPKLVEGQVGYTDGATFLRSGRAA